MIPATSRKNLNPLTNKPINEMNFRSTLDLNIRVKEWHNVGLIRWLVTQRHLHMLVYFSVSLMVGSVVGYVRLFWNGQVVVLVLISKG